MKKIKMPNFSIKNIIEENDDDFEKEINDLIEEEKEYMEKGGNKKLYEIKESKHEKIKGLYKKFYGDPKYRYRLEIIGETVRCPICGSPFGYGTLWLDHVLPQSRFEKLAITPINLVPFCSSCNRGKGTKIGNEEMGILNPYFNYYELKSYLELNIISIDNKIDIEIEIKEYSEILNEKKIEEQNYKKIRFHIELYKIRVTLKNRAKAVYETTLLDEIKLGRKQSLKENQVKLKLKAIQNKEYIDSAEYLDEEFFKQKIIDGLLNSENSLELIKTCANEVNKKIKNEENFDGDNV
jgi:HNH nuclease